MILMAASKEVARGWAADGSTNKREEIVIVHERLIRLFYVEGLTGRCIAILLDVLELYLVHFSQFGHRAHAMVADKGR
jgi:hypothetical protein